MAAATATATAGSTAFPSLIRPQISLRHRTISADIVPSSANLLSRPATSAGLSCCATFAISPAAAAAASSSQSVSFDALQQFLSSKNYREADEETRRLLIVLAGEAAQKRGYVFFSEAQFIAEDDLRKIDDLWAQNSDNKFGYSVQRKIWEKCNRDFTKFFIKVGWMKKLEASEIEQYNYRAFPGEFVWELGESTPEGHLPLTNALRGTQLLSSILTHPAFGGSAAGEEEDPREEARKQSPADRGTFKPNYSF